MNNRSKGRRKCFLSDPYRNLFRLDLLPRSSPTWPPRSPVLWIGGTQSLDRLLLRALCWKVEVRMPTGIFLWGRPAVGTTLPLSQSVQVFSTYILLAWSLIKLWGHFTYTRTFYHLVLHSAVVKLLIFVYIFIILTVADAQPHRILQGHCRKRSESLSSLENP